MAEFADRLERLSVEATSPDGQISGRVAGRLKIDVALRAGSYGRYSDSEVGHQLSQLAPILWSRYRREYDEVTAAYQDWEPAPYEEPEDATFRERRAALTVRGRSLTNWITVSSRGMVRWEFAVAPGAVRTLTEVEFLSELDSAVQDLLRHWRLQVIVLTDALYGIGVPNSLRHTPTGL